MDALTYLLDQHDEMDGIINGIEDASESRKKKALFGQMADKLAAHAAIEEKIFYPAVKAKQTDEMLLESTEEHLSIKRVLADMLALSVEDKRFDAKLLVLKEQLDHHNRDEEEVKLFPKVLALLSKDELDGLGGEMAAAYEQMITKHPRDSVPSETKRAGSGRLSEPVP